MSQHDQVIANQAGAAFRADLNAALAAIFSNNSGATEPAVTVAYQWWADTTTGILKQRNAANTAWISLMTLSTGVMSANAALAGSTSQAWNCSTLICADTTDASSSIAGAMKTAGGLAVAKKAYIGSELYPHPTKGVVGTTTNDDAQAGSIGECISSQVVQASAVSLTTNVDKTVTSISLSAGDWDVSAVVGFIQGASTTYTRRAASIHTVADTVELVTGYQDVPPTGAPGAIGIRYTLMPKRVSLASPTTIYLTAAAQFAVSTAGAFGTISARRVR